MLTLKAWLHFFEGNGAPVKDSIAKELLRAGVETDDPDGGFPSGPGLVFFDEATLRLCEFLREASRNGVERVLAVAFPHSAPASEWSWRLLQAGASDVFSWNHSDTPAEEISARLARWADVDRLVDSPLVRNNLVGRSPSWSSLLRRIVEAARFTDASTILIMGETGTGKELAARLIHTLDPRPDKRDLVVLDCTTIVPELSGSEFFGHERGAYTSAVAPREGAFALANGGTLFLDEVGDLPLTLQAQLLRVIQERTYKRVGGNSWLKTDFRLVCATNKDLFEEVARGRFRRDLYYRIANWACRLPSLRERTGDILPLAHHFMKELRPNQYPSELDEPVRTYLLQRDYPGNVRDLKQLICRIVDRHVGPGPITLGDIPEEERPLAECEEKEWRDTPFEQAIRQALSLGVGLKKIGRAAEETAIRIVVADENGNLQRAAQKLGVTDRALQMRQAARRENRQTGE